MKYIYAKNTSKLHKKIGEVLETESPWTAFKGQQEVLVSDLFEDFYGRERYDWVIHELSLIIECHGIQHYKLQSFGADAANAMMNFKEQKKRDLAKKKEAVRNGWTYVEVPYVDEKKINGIYIWEKFKENESGTKATVKSTTKVESEYDKKQKQKAKEHRRKAYLRAKEFKKERTKDS